jgi:hypothetical protein
MKRALRMALSASVLFIALGSAMAQVVARQGTASQPDVVKFNSPMILELPVSALAKLPPGSAVEVPNDIRKYICDNDVSFTNVRVGKRIQSRREGLLQLVVSGFLTVRSSYDRSADVTIRLKKAEEVLATGTTLNISAEEERNTAFRVTASMSDSKLRDAYLSDPQPTLEIVLTVRDNS